MLGYFFALQQVSAESIMGRWRFAETATVASFRL
jgi:hypothetical protein